VNPIPPALLEDSQSENYPDFDAGMKPFPLRAPSIFAFLLSDTHNISRSRPDKATRSWNRWLANTQHLI